MRSLLLMLSVGSGGLFATSLVVLRKHIYIYSFVLRDSMTSLAPYSTFRAVTETSGKMTAACMR